MALNEFEGKFRVDVFDPTGVTKLGSIMTVVSMQRTRKLNEVGMITFSFSSADPALLLITFGVQYQLWGNPEGLIDTFIHKDYSIDAGGEQPMVTVNAWMNMRELATRSAKFNRIFTNVPVQIAAQSIIAAANEADPYLGPPSPGNLWTCNVTDPGNTLGSVTLEIQGQTILEALDALRKVARVNFRQVGSRTVEFGTFASVNLTIYNQAVYNQNLYLGTNPNSPVKYATNIEMATPEVEAGSRILVTNAKIVTSSDKIINRVIMLGSGDGINQLTMQATYDSYAAHKPPDSTSSYVVKRNANPDNIGRVWLIKMLTHGSGYSSDPTVTLVGGGYTVVATAKAVRDATIQTVNSVVVVAGGAGYTSVPAVQITGGGGSGATAEAYISTYYYYVEDTTSITNYGVFEAVISESNIHPLTNSDRQILYASDALYYGAVAYLTKNVNPQVVYQCEVLNFPTTENVGDIIRLRYRGLILISGTSYRYVDIDVQVAVMDIDESWQAGALTTSITLSTNGERGLTDLDVILGVHRDLNALQVRVQPYPSREVINKERMIDNSHPCEFELFIEDDVLYLISAQVQWVTRPFRTNVSPSLGVASSQTFDIHSVPAGPTFGFSYLSDDAGGNTDFTHPLPFAMQITPYPRSLSDPLWRLGRVADHGHGFPINPGMNNAGDLTDAWFVTFNGTGLFVGSLNHGNPSFGGNYFYLFPPSNGSTFATEHQHEYYIPNHFHTFPGIDLSGITLSYGITDDTDVNQNTPTSIAIYLDGSLVGAGFPSGNNQTRNIDIAAALQNAPSGLRKTHVLRFECASGRGTIEVSVRLYMALQATIRTVNWGGS